MERSEKAWRKMIEKALEQNIKIVLLTPTPDLKEDITDANAPLEAHAEMIRRLASEYHVGWWILTCYFRKRQKKAKKSSGI